MYLDLTTVALRIGELLTRYLQLQEESAPSWFAADDAVIEPPSWPHWPADTSRVEVSLFIRE